MTRIVVSRSERPRADLWSIETVERKGVGHPDTLCDGVAEAISRSYSLYCLERFGRIANHWVDKCMLVGGRSELAFGAGSLVEPMTLLVVGKVTTSIGSEQIPFDDIARATARSFFAQMLPRLDVERDLHIESYVNDATGAGRPARWYQPRSAADLLAPSEMRSNDAVICCGYGPLSRLENFVLETERRLNGPDYKATHPEVGSDIKVLATRVEDTVDVVACVPFIADLTPSREFYDLRKMEVEKDIQSLADELLDGYTVIVRTNTRDDSEAVYMTATGTAADTGDCGAVGRGNRMNGLIAPGRLTSVEAPAGKNPVCHGGKLYGVLATRLAAEIGAVTGENYVTITTSTGRPLAEPDLVAVQVADCDPDAIRARATELVEAGLDGIGGITDELVNGTRPLW